MRCGRDYAIRGTYATLISLQNFSRAYARVHTFESLCSHPRTQTGATRIAVKGNLVKLTLCTGLRGV